MVTKRALKNVYILLGAFLLLGAVIKIGIAYPTHPIGPNTLEVVKSERLANTSYGPKSTWAQAGNVTELVINATSPTRSWQGYFGNISGKLTLDDANNNTLYDWTMLEPRGKIFAAINQTINWERIRCFNFTSDEGGQEGTGWFETTINATTENNRTGLTNVDADNINNTFIWTTHKRFQVGVKTIVENMCPATATYINNGSQSESTGAAFVEVLLTDAVPSNALVFMTFIENQDPYNFTDVIGFDGKTHDFQMLVLEDGRSEAHRELLTLYYFWVELEG